MYLDLLVNASKIERMATGLEGMIQKLSFGIGDGKHLRHESSSLGTNKQRMTKILSLLTLVSVVLLGAGYASADLIIDDFTQVVNHDVTR